LKYSKQVIFISKTDPQAIFIYYRKLEIAIPHRSHLPKCESGTVMTYDDFCDRCDHQLTDLVVYNIKSFEKKNCPKVKSVGKS